MTHRIITGSCLDPEIGLPSLADKSVDVCITDPPYEKQAHTLQRRIKPAGWRDGAQVVDAPLAFEAMTDAQRCAVAMEIARVTRQRAIVFCQVEGVMAWVDAFTETGMPYRRTTPWVKTNAQPCLHGRFPGQSFECIALFQWPSASVPPCGGRAVSYRRASIDQPRFHMTEKPLDLMRAIVSDFANPGETIIDPYAGSGTTIAAAKMLGHPATGWELDPEMASKARRRIEGQPRVSATGQGLLFG